MENQHTPQDLSSLARKLYKAFQDGARDVLEELFHDELVFTSPHDKGLSKQQFFDICFPFSEQVIQFEMLKVLEQGNDVCVVYRCTAKEMEPFENADLLTFDGGKVKRIRVFFGDK